VSFSRTLTMAGTVSPSPSPISVPSHDPHLARTSSAIVVESRMGLRELRSAKDHEIRNIDSNAWNQPEKLVTRALHCSQPQTFPCLSIISDGCSLKCCLSSLAFSCTLVFCEATGLTKPVVALLRRLDWHTTTRGLALLCTPPHPHSPPLWFNHEKICLMPPLLPSWSPGNTLVVVTICTNSILNFFRRQPGWALSKHTGWALMTLRCIECFKSFMLPVWTLLVAWSWCIRESSTDVNLPNHDHAVFDHKTLRDRWPAEG